MKAELRDCVAGGVATCDGHPADSGSDDQFAEKMSHARAQESRRASRADRSPSAV